MRDQRFTVLLSPAERRVLADLAAHERRTQGDTVRVLVLEAAAKKLSTGTPTPPSEPAA